MTENVTDATKAVATRDNGGHALIARYQQDLRQVLPTHVNGDQWIRLAQGALKKGKKVRAPDGVMRTELEIAAMTNVGVFLGQLSNAARLGLEPGTEQFYLTARKVKGNPEVLGIVGYQGYIELMYRAGAISSVIAENVYEHDAFVWRAGTLDDHRPPRWEGPQRQPFHDVNWYADDRGALKLVYAYAIMRDGAVSKVVVLNEHNIKKIRAASSSAGSAYSPWTTHTDAMWLKSAVRQLAKWVPTSAEYVREQLRAARDVALEVGQVPAGFAPPAPAGPVDISGLLDADDQDPEAVVDAEIVDDPEAEWARDAQS